MKRMDKHTLSIRFGIVRLVLRTPSAWLTMSTTITTLVLILGLVYLAQAF